MRTTPSTPEPPATPPELVAPAGTPDKLRTAFHFGADAVYLGLKKFSMRRFAGNFDLDQLAWALDLARQEGRRVYVAFNVLPADHEFAQMEPVLRDLGKLRPHGIVVGDAGVLRVARGLVDGVPLHLSTQLSVTSGPAARFWFDQGIARIVLARELSLEQIAGVVAGGGGSFETFIHGAQCIAYSGRCFLSLYWAGRDPRKGACAQGCRWPYRAIEDSRRPGEPNPIAQDERGTYFFDAKDLCALPLLDQLLATGVQALKIEGRTRSAHYVGVVTDVYRHAVDQLAAGDHEGFAARRDAYMAELSRPTNRGFSTHFLGGGEPGIDAYNPDGSPLDHRNDFLGEVVAAGSDHVDIRVGYPIRPGDHIELRDRGLVSRTTRVEHLAAPDGTPLDFGRPRTTVRLAGSFGVQSGALVRRHKGA